MFALEKRRFIKWAIVALVFLIPIVFIAGPGGIETIYRTATTQAEIDALKKRYNDLDSAEKSLGEHDRLASAYRRGDIYAWLWMRGFDVDGGDEHDGYTICEYAIYRWKLIFAYWKRDAKFKSTKFLLNGTNRSTEMSSSKALL